MKLHQEHDNDDRLNEVLRAWTEDSLLPPRFQERVWQRIGQAETRAEPASWAWFLHSFGQVLVRPKAAFSYLAVLLAAGMAAGAWAARVQTNHLDADLGLRYVQSVDPYATVALNP